MSLRKWICFSGVLWLAIGSLLMVKGLRWLAQAAIASEQTPLVGWVSSLVGSRPQGALLVIAVALFIGLVKGRTVLSKTVFRVVSRLKSQTVPIRLSNLYDRRYYLILGSMMGLGLLFRFLPIPLDIRGAIDVIIGSALINGAMIYFREALMPKTI